MIFQDGFDNGVEQGITQESEKKLVQQVCRKLQKKKTPEIISEELKEKPDCDC